MSSVQFEGDFKYRQARQEPEQSFSVNKGIIYFMISRDIVQNEKQARKVLNIIAITSFVAACIVVYTLLINPAQTKATDPSRDFLKNPPIKIR